MDSVQENLELPLKTTVKKLQPLMKDNDVNQETN